MRVGLVGRTSCVNEMFLNFIPPVDIIGRQQASTNCSVTTYLPPELSCIKKMLIRIKIFSPLHLGSIIGRAVTFSGQCANKAISIIIRGTLVAPSEYTFVGDALQWLTFEQVSGVSVHGGVLDARGVSSWDCKNQAKVNCPIGAAVCYVHIVSYISRKMLITHLISTCLD
ncbi:Polygalacturonase protein [Spatholobus suberectus]|nr:Polygalacturonase protein [Spatholobus suberectus]